MREAGWEIASHGLKWIDYRDMPEAEERAHMREAIRIHTAVTGERPLGWYTGRNSVNTLKAVLDDGGFLYSSRLYADDLPYWVNGPKCPHLIIPYTLDANDMRFVNPQGFARRRGVLHLSPRRASTCSMPKATSAPKMMSVRPALPAGRTARTARPGSRAFSITLRATIRVWIARRLDDRAATGIKSTRRWRRRAGDRVRGASMAQISLEDINALDKAALRGRARRHLRARAVGRGGAPMGRVRSVRSPRCSTP